MCSVTNCITKTKNTEVDDPPDINIVIALYNSIEYRDAYSKTSGQLWKYYRDETPADNNNNITGFPDDNNNNVSFKIK